MSFDRRGMYPVNNCEAPLLPKLLGRAGINYDCLPSLPKLLGRLGGHGQFMRGNAVVKYRAVGLPNTGGRCVIVFSFPFLSAKLRRAANVESCCLSLSLGYFMVDNSHNTFGVLYFIQTLVFRPLLLVFLASIFADRFHKRLSQGTSAPRSRTRSSFVVIV